MPSHPWAFLSPHPFLPFLLYPSAAAACGTHDTTHTTLITQRLFRPGSGTPPEDVGAAPRTSWPASPGARRCVANCNYYKAATQGTSECGPQATALPRPLRSVSVALIHAAKAALRRCVTRRSNLMPHAHRHQCKERRATDRDALQVPERTAREWHGRSCGCNTRPASLRLLPSLNALTPF